MMNVKAMCKSKRICYSHLFKKMKNIRKHAY